MVACQIVIVILGILIDGRVLLGFFVAVLFTTIIILRGLLPGIIHGGAAAFYVVAYVAPFYFRSFYRVDLSSPTTVAYVLYPGVGGCIAIACVVVTGGG